MMPPFNAEIAEHTGALRNLKLLIGWMLGIPQRSSGNGFLRQTSTTNLLSAARHILGTSAAGQPHFQPTVAKSSISTSVHWLAAFT